MKPEVPASAPEAAKPEASAEAPKAFCRKCGAKLTGNKNFCPKCGTPVNTPHL
ncbi:MAG: zinc-ribbon domain-containing protein [Clostridia bacterium]|nr:zinc-ribbon domain-containing protein [Clostridia bacterium]